MPQRLIFASILALLITGIAEAQCPAGTVAITADRDNTLYEDGSGMLSNGAGDYLFAGRTRQGSDEIRRGLVHFDVAAAVDPGSTIATATLLLTLDQPRDNGTYSVGLHTVQADWGEGTSQAGMGEGGGDTATTNDATWLNTFFNTMTWTTPGGDFAAGASATTLVNGGASGVYSWRALSMVSDTQAWLDSAGTNYGWLLMGEEDASETALRFGSRLNTGNEPTLCLEVCPGQTDCTLFSDGFESGDTTAWSSTSP